jgi:hypothetical protein
MSRSFYSIGYWILLIASFFCIASCAEITELKVDMADAVKANTTSPIKITRTGTGSNEWEMGDKDGFNYHFSAYPHGKFQITEVEGKENDYCHTTESNEVSDGHRHSEVVRDMFIKEKDMNEITLAIACHKRMYRFNTPDSVVSIQMVVEDADDHVMDTVVFKILR